MARAQIDLEDYPGVRGRANALPGAKVNVTCGRRERFAGGKVKRGAPDPQIVAIEQKRKRLKLPVAAFLARAAVDPRTYERLLAGRSGSAQRETLQRLKAALELPARAAAPGEFLVKAFYGACLAIVCAELGADVGAVRAFKPFPVRRADPAWLAAADARRLALYLANTLGGVKLGALAGVAGVTKAAVCIACREVELARDHDGFDAVVTACEQKIGGSF